MNGRCCSLLCVYGRIQIHGFGDWPYNLASRVARELWALIKDVFPGLWCEEPAVTVLCNACGATLGTLSDLARRISEVEVVCADRGCGHSHQLQPFVGVAAGATTQADAAWEYWFQHVRSIRVKHHRMRCLVDVADAVLRCAPIRPGVPRLWVPVPTASTPTRPGSPASLRPFSSSSGPRACTLRPVCAHRDCLHAIVDAETTHGDGQNASAAASFWNQLAISDSTEREQVTRWLSRVSKTLQLFTTTQRDALHTVPQAELERCRGAVLSIISRGRHVSLGRRRMNVNETLAQLFAALGDCGLRCVCNGGLGDLYVCDKHTRFYTVREASVRTFTAMMQEMERRFQERLDAMTRMQQRVLDNQAQSHASQGQVHAQLADVTANQGQMQAQMRDNAAAMARRQRAIHDHGHHPRMFVLALAPTTSSAHALAGKVTCHLYLLCEHGGVPHPVKFRNTDEWRRVPVGIPNGTLRAMAPGLSLLRTVCQAASIVSGAASTLASLLGDVVPYTKCVLCCVAVWSVECAVSWWNPVVKPGFDVDAVSSFTRLSQPIDATVGSALNGRGDVDGITSRQQLAEQERDLRSLQQQFEADRSTHSRNKLVRCGVPCIARQMFVPCRVFGCCCCHVNANPCTSVVSQVNKMRSVAQAASGEVYRLLGELLRRDDQTQAFGGLVFRTVEQSVDWAERGEGMWVCTDCACEPCYSVNPSRHSPTPLHAGAGVGVPAAAATLAPHPAPVTGPVHRGMASATTAPATTAYSTTASSTTASSTTASMAVSTSAQAVVSPVCAAPATAPPASPTMVGVTVARTHTHNTTTHQDGASVTHPNPSTESDGSRPWKAAVFITLLQVLLCAVSLAVGMGTVMPRLQGNRSVFDDGWCTNATTVGQTNLTNSTVSVNGTAVPIHNATTHTPPSCADQGVRVHVLCAYTCDTTAYSHHVVPVLCVHLGVVLRVQNEFAWIVTVGIAVTLAGAAPAGMLLDRWGPRHTLCGCLMLLAVGQAVLAVAPRSTGDSAFWLVVGVACVSLSSFGVGFSALSARWGRYCPCLCHQRTRCSTLIREPVVHSPGRACVRACVYLVCIQFPCAAALDPCSDVTVPGSA